MCGIAGIVSKREAVDREVVLAMGAALTHRGPDDTGSYFHGRVGFVQTRLSIIDLDTGQQPLFNAARTLVLVANGEIYNHVELRAQLERCGHQFQTHSDCEVILHAYAEFGDEFLSHLVGMFAFALYDVQRDKVLLARDRLGIKPLFARVMDDAVAFGSEVKPLLWPLGQAPALDPTALVRFLQCNFASGSQTAVHGVERVAAGEAMWIGDGRVEKRWRYWAAEPSVSTTPENQLFDEFSALMDTVVAEHLRSDVPIGLFLSSGVDSSLLLALMTKAGVPALDCYTVGFAGTSVTDELPAAQALAGSLGANHHAIETSGEDMLARLPLALWCADELMGDYANLPTLMLAERAGQDLKVVFTGEGGDEGFAGYGRYRTSWMKRLRTRLQGRRREGFRSGVAFNDRSIDTVFTDELRAVAGKWDAPFESAWSRGSNTSALSRRQLVDIETWLPDDLLVKADRMLMGFGVEGRVPFLDHRVVEFGLSLPPALKVQGRTGKVFLKRWAERLLPADVLNARKKGFTVPVKDWLSGDFLDALERRLPEHPGLARWCKPDGVRNVIRAHRANGGRAQQLWGLLQLALWHAVFVENEGRRPATKTDPLSLL